MKTIISLDYDNTYTRDADFWLEFIKNAQAQGHIIICCTMRYQAETLNADFDPRLRELVEVFPTGRKAKRSFMRTAGYNIDVWIDDDVDAITNDYV